MVFQYSAGCIDIHCLRTSFFGPEAISDIIGTNAVPSAVPDTERNFLHLLGFTAQKTNHLICIGVIDGNNLYQQIL